MGAAGVERINAHFSWRACAEKTAALYEQVLAQRGERPYA
jgi:glycosyltransferase involved in cell wall biosynthesis